MAPCVYRVELQIPYGTLIDWRETHSENAAHSFYRAFHRRLRRTGGSGFIPVLLNGAEIAPDSLTPIPHRKK